MTLPVMEPDLDGDVLEAWARAVDQGPYSSLCFGERVLFDNPETLTLLGACAAQPPLPPARSTGLPFPDNDRELETPNSLPPGFTTINPMAPATGTVGVTQFGAPARP